MLGRTGIVLLTVMIGLMGCDDGDDSGTMTGPPVDAAVADAGTNPDVQMPSDAESPPDAGEASDGEPPQPDAGPLDAAPIPALMAGEDRQAEPEALAADTVSAAYPLADDVVLAQVGDAFHWITPDSETPLTGVDGALRGAVGLGDETVVATETGLFALRDTALVPSPLAEYLSDVWTVVATGNDTAWFVGEDGIRVWQSGRLHDFALAEAPNNWAEIMIAAGPYNGNDALWLAMDDVVYALAFDAATPEAWSVMPGGVVSTMTATAEGLWITLDGDLAHLDRDNTWHVWTLPFEVESLSGHADAPDVWMSTAEGLYQLRDGQLRAIADAPAFTGLTTADDGSALLWGETGLHRVRPGRFVRLVGLEEGATIRGDLTIAVEATRPDTVSAVEVTFDDGDATLLQGPPWTFVVSPRTLGAGRHAVGVDVRYADESVVNVSAHFEVVGPPTWEVDIEPMFVQHCDACHGPRGYAHRMETLEVWVDEIDEIIDAVVTGRMPLTPNPLLTEAEIQLIRDWEAAEFPETWP